jgi:hypothetical protein
MLAASSLAVNLSCESIVDNYNNVGKAANGQERSRFYINCRPLQIVDTTGQCTYCYLLVRNAQQYGEQ